MSRLSRFKEVVCKLIPIAVTAVALNSSPLTAAVPYPDCGYNCFRFYGYITQILTSSVTPDWRALTIHPGLPGSGDVVRLECPDSSVTGCDQLVMWQWVALEGRMTGQDGPLDGVNTVNRVTVSIRWNGTLGYWEVYDQGSSGMGWIPY